MSVRPAPVLPERLDPGAIECFRILGGEIDHASGHVSLRYALDDEWAFEEVIELGPEDPAGAVRREAVERGVALLALCAGVSYYKAAAPGRIALAGGPPGPAAAELANALYGPGLAEFRWVNELALDPGELFAGGSGGGAPTAGLGPGALTAVGGGKDSVVSVEALRAAGHEQRLFSVGDADPIRRTADVSGLGRTVVTRRLSPALLAANERGARNGHVPVTAVVSVIASLVALREGRAHVVLSNERSARAGSFRAEGVEVNHQWSKGLEAERLLDRALREEVAADLRCFSLLRGASELAIARAFARLPAYHHAFTSCNRVFRLDPARRHGSWCTDCPKCRFVFLALAPWLEPAVLESIFSRNMLGDPAQLPGFLALVGVDAEKPFECVGEVEESLAAFRLLAARPEWASAAVVAAVAERVLGALPASMGDPETVLAYGEEHLIPERYRPAARAALTAR